MRVLVDRCSVEVFGGRGETAITDLVFPSTTSDRVEVYATGGTVGVTGTVSPMRSAWTAP